MKRSRMIILCIVLAAVLMPWAALAEAETPEAYSLEGSVYPSRRMMKDGDEPVESEITLYFVNGGDIPYISLADFFPFLADLEQASSEWDVTYDVTAGANQMFIVSRADNQSSMVVNAEADTILFPNFDRFVSKPGTSALVNVIDLPESDTTSINDKVDQIMSRIKEGVSMTEEEVEALIKSADDPKYDLFALSMQPYNRSGSMLVLNLADYSIDLIARDGACYVPFQTLNDIFISPLYATCVFNGQAMITAGWGCSFLDTMYEAEPQPMSKDFAAFNFRELCFNLDHFYGLREEHGIARFADMLVQNGDLFAQLTDTDSYVFDSALNKLTTYYLDDGHSGFKHFSWRTGKMSGAEIAQMLGSLGMSGLQKLGIGWHLQRIRDEVYPGGIPQYEEIGDTAFITFNQFTVKQDDSENYYHLENPDDPQDTIELILYAHRQITREDSPVRNIVIDLSMNGGGNATAAVFATAWFAGKAMIDLRDPLTGAQSITTYLADVNLNGIFTNDPGDTVAGGDYNLYCMISSQSFSCGNLLPACFRESGIVTLIGQKSGGGSCVVRPCTTASGAVFQISGTKQLSTVINGSFYNIDQGIDPDIRLTKAESFFDRPGLVELIHSSR